MSGPGIGRLVSRIISGNVSKTDLQVLQCFDINRSFDQAELLK